MKIIALVIFKLLITGSAASQAATDPIKPNKGTGDIMGVVYDNWFLSLPPYYLILFNRQRSYQRKIANYQSKYDAVNSFSFGFDSIVAGTYSLALIDSIPAVSYTNQIGRQISRPLRIQSDTLFGVEVRKDFISFTPMYLEYITTSNDNKKWKKAMVHRRLRNHAGSIEGRFNVEAYEEVTGCKFEPVQRDEIRSGDKGKYASVYLAGVDSYKQKVHTDAAGNFKFDDLPIGYYEIVAEKESKKESCDEGWSVVSDYPMHRSYKIIQLLVVPNKTSLVEIDEIDPQEVFVDYLYYDIKLQAETVFKWKPRLKK